VLNGIEKNPKGKIEIDVTIEIDVDEVTTIVTRAKASGMQVKYVVSPDRLISQEQIDEIVEDAEKNHDDDVNEGGG